MEQNALLNVSELFSEAVPAWVVRQEVPESVNAPDKDFSDGVMFLLVERQINFGAAGMYYHVVMRITSAVGLQQNSSVRIEFSPAYESVAIHRVGITRNGSYIDMASPERLKIVELNKEEGRFVYSGVRAFDIHFEDTRVGDVIEYAYTTHGINPIFDGRFVAQYLLGYSSPVGLIYHQIIVPVGREVKFNIFGSDKVFSRKTEGGNIINEMLLRDAPRIAIEDSLPGWYEPLPFYCATEFKSWEELSKWAGNLFRDEAEQGGLLDGIVRDIMVNHALIPGRIRAALTFVQNEIHYLADNSGIYDFTPHPPELVLKQRFGDCKDKSLLLCAILRKLGIKADPALVNTYLRENVLNRPPIPYAFNHCVVRVVHEGTAYWYDPTRFGQGGDIDGVYFPNFTAALLLDENNPGMISIPYRKISHISIEETFELGGIQDPGQLEVRTVYGGGVADDQRLYFQRESLSDIEKRFMGYYANVFGEIKSGPSVRTEDDPVANTFTIKEHYAFVNPWKSVQGNDKMAKIDITFHGMKNCLPVPGIKERIMPIGVPDDVNVEHRISINCQQSLKDQKISKKLDEFGISHSVDLSISGSRVEAVSKLTTSWDHVVPEQTKEYIDLLDKFFGEIDYELKVSATKSKKSGFTVPQGAAIFISLVIWLLIRNCT